MKNQPEDYLTSLRREFHQYPEPGWCEYFTTSQIVDELERIGVDEYYIGAEALSESDRLAVPPKNVRMKWFDKANERGARTDVLKKRRVQ